MLVSENKWVYQTYNVLWLQKLYFTQHDLKV